MILDLHNVAVTRMPDGQPHIKLGLWGWHLDEPILIRTRIRNSEDLFVLLMAVDILRRRFSDAVELQLEVSYLMGGRMDRPIDSTQPFTLKVVTDVINNVGFSRVYLHHPHSDVSTALLNAKVIAPHEFWAKSVREFQNDLEDDDIVVLAPDAGAAKSVGMFSYENSLTMIQCLKTRDEQTGELHGFHVLTSEAELRNRPVLILDDLCDGGGTFKGIASELDKLASGPIGLAVTHGIFSKGYNFGVDHIYTTNSYSDIKSGVPIPTTTLKVYDIFTLEEL